MNLDAKQLLALYEPKPVKVVDTDHHQMCVARYSPCGKFLIGGGCDGRVYRWDASTDDMPALEPLAGHGGFVGSLGFQPQGELMFTADSWGRMCAWPYADAAPQPRWSVDDAHRGWIRALAVSPDGRLLATCGTDQLVRIWEAATGKKLHELSLHQEDVFCVQFHPDGKHLVSGDLKGLVKQWNASSGQHVRDFNAKDLYLYDRLQDIGGVRILAFNPEGTVLLAAGTRPRSGGNVQGIPLALVFDWTTGKQTRTWELTGSTGIFFHDLHWDSRGFIMAAASGNPGAGVLLFQRLEDDAPFFLSTKLANCHALSLHPNGRRLAVMSTNANSAGNGRVKSKNGEQDYPGNWSPLNLFDLPQPPAAEQPAADK